MSSILVREKSHSIMSYADLMIYRRDSDGYLNATAMCKATKKEIGHYFENKTTKEFIDVCSSDIGIPISGLVIVKDVK